VLPHPTIGIALIALALLVANTGLAQTTNSPAEVSTNDSVHVWGFSASVYGYLVPHSRDYVSPVVTADHHWLHAEARYNYEAFETGSLWAGYNFSTGEKLVFSATPMLGGVFGNTRGVAPGWNLSLSYKKIALSSNSEYLFDSAGSSGNFFYDWSELTYSPWDWLQAGLVVQRTRAYQTSLDIQRGFLVGVTYKKVAFTTYVFNLGWTEPTVVLAAMFTY
jgi:hypothetical protein